MTTERYTFEVVDAVKITDGDTYWLRLDIGFRETLLANIRLDGYDTPERARGSEFEREEAKLAANVASIWFDQVKNSPGVTVWVRTKPDPDSFGRWLGDLWAENEEGRKRHLGAHLRDLRLASVWPRRWRDEFDQ